MTFISALKEGFALAPIEERQHVVDKLAAPNTSDSYYYQGLVILQKIHAEVMNVDNPIQTRSPSQAELDLSTQLKEIIAKLKEMRDYTRCEQLESRFHLLAYPYQTAATIEYMKERLSISGHQQSATQSDKESLPEADKTPSVLDASLIDDAKLIQKSLLSITQYNYRVNEMAFPHIGAFWDNLDRDAQLKLINNSKYEPSIQLFGSDIVKKISTLVSLRDKERNDGLTLSFYNYFTLNQMDELMELLPRIVYSDTYFVHGYLDKLVPTNFNKNQKVWDDHENALKDYLDRAESFASKLPMIYRQLKSAIQFHKLCIDITRQDFSQERFLSYLSTSFSRDSTPTPTRASNPQNKDEQKSVRLPLFDAITDNQRNIVIEEYLTGLISRDQLTVSIESLGTYLDYHNYLKPLIAKIKLTTCTPIRDDWVRDLGNSAYESLIKESVVSFANTSLKASVKRRPSDTISLFVKTKNIPRLSIRVFQIDTENYWRIHLNDENSATEDINLDGFRPTFEQDVDFSTEAAIHIKYTEFKFGQGGLAPEVFNGRGLWVIEFVGGENQCRAIIQKGYLRHIMQNNSAGHVLRVLNEDGQVMEKAKVLYNKQVYQTDDNCNILIPYNQDKNATKKIILVSSVDKYCEPASFYHLKETYHLEASFYVNPEMVSFNKAATVVVVPKLTLNGLNVPLSLLDDTTTLTVETVTINNIKNVSTCQKSSSSGETIRFKFMVPDQLSMINYTLKAKVKATNGKSIDVTASHCQSFESSDKGITSTFHLRKMANNKYFIYVFGKNGEYKKNYKLTVSLDHLFVRDSVEVQLQTNESGTIELGKLQNIKSVCVTDAHLQGKKWLIPDEYHAVLPDRATIAENVQFKLTCNTKFHNSLYSLYTIEKNGIYLEDVTSKYFQKENGFVSIQGLPEGEYKLNLPTLQQGIRNITFTVIKPQVNVSEHGIWSNWLVGKKLYGKQNTMLLQKPLEILETTITNKDVQVKLNHWNSKTFAIVTTSTFVLGEAESLYANVVQQKLSFVETLQYDIDSTRSLFLNDKRISEEYQYILNRAKAEKWTGSNLTKPSLLVYPKKHADTYATKRNLGQDTLIKKEGEFRKFKSLCAGGAPFYAKDNSLKTATNLAFLDHNSPLVVVPVSAEDGNIVIDKKNLGHGGNLFQIVVFSGEQAVFYQQLLNDNDNLKFNDLRQSSNSNKTLIRSKTISKVLPNECINLQTHEYETIDSFEKMFDTVVMISRQGEQLKDSFEFLKSWSSLNLQKKLEIHQEHVCHEFNLWLKKKDPQFFEDNVKPVIKTKLQKEFIDFYLIDADLSQYRENLHFFSSLSVAEKALLASTGPKDYLRSVLQYFTDSFDGEKKIKESDAIFDTILLQRALSGAAESLSVEENEDCDDDDMGFDLFDSQCVNLCSEEISTKTVVFTGETSIVPASLPAGVAAGVFSSSDSVNQEVDLADEDHDSIAEQENKMRNEAKKITKKVVYEFVQPTSEWSETGYRELQPVSLQKFWIDYLEYCASDKTPSTFLSENFIYSLNNMQEIWFVLSLMDLPFAAEKDWSLESINDNSSNKVGFSIKSNNYPLLVFYRTLSESGQSLSSNSSRNLMLSQEIFVVDDSAPIQSDECIKIDPSIQSLEPLVEYGNHLIVTNISAKAVTCQITVQIPTGALPTQNGSYYLSKTISIKPYSTWHEVVNTFYFPSSGEFAAVPVTVSSITGDQLLGKINTIPMHVKDHSEGKATEAFDTNTVTSQLWSKVASKGNNDSVISYLKSYKKLSKLDMSLIKWRMVDKQFARQVLDVLSNRCFYTNVIWQYGIVNQFEDIIREYLLANPYPILQKTGYVFESPLVSKNAIDHKEFNVYDYYPLFNARAHQMKSDPEILNGEFYKQYECFLEYLSSQTYLPSDTDLVILVTYLLLQDRIGEAHNVFKRIQNLENNDQCQLQIDYLRAYLKTRVSVTKDSSYEQQLDLQHIKDIAEKYKDFGVLRWRKLFSNLHDFVCEVEQGNFAVSNSTIESKRVRSEPILEFEIDEKENELVLKYANLKSVEVKYYPMDIEVMFSNNPFMDTENNKSSSNKNISWIKSSISQTIMLPEKSEIDKENDQDFDMIGVGQINSLQLHRVPFTTTKKNVFIEVSGGNITRQHTYYANSLSVQFVESFGVVGVMCKETKRPISGVYVKVYCRKKGSSEVHFWKDGYTGLNGVFDYISVTQGNALTNNGSLKKLMSEDIEKLSVLILSEEEGAIVKEVYPPEEN